MAARAALESLREQLITEETTQNRYKRGMMNFSNPSGGPSNDALFTRNCVLHDLWKGKTPVIQSLQQRIRAHQQQQESASYRTRGSREPQSDRHFEYVTDRVNSLSRELQNESRERRGF
eukprot:TRINITY_DN1264_c0_g1_i2.p2 TRINITY_DN1264_c0_g1~~TRINITY_DN1264_c0_g1_i2.p2  ORF type:complete len:119 (+),score=30.35 TRINITY_DN1264_c0_g1_i2:44-400(+)